MPDQPASKMPLPMGVRADTGQTRPPLTEDDLHHITGDSAAVLARGKRGKVLSVSSTVDDASDLSQAGWGVLLASDADPAILEALKPLLDRRRGQVQEDRLFKIFQGPAGVRPTQRASSWAANKGISLVSPVEPFKGVPYYLLMVGSPKAIPFEFQAEFDLQWAVGRLHFDKPEDYAAYAQNVVDYETGKVPPRTRRAALWMTRNPGDLATALLSGTIAPDFLGETNAANLTLGQKQKFELSSYIGAGQATKSRLADILRGKDMAGLPSVLFTGSHGAEFPISDPAVQRELQGALVTQEWSGQPLLPEHYFSAADIPADAQIHGMIAFLFACYGGGCPDTDNYFFAPDGSRLPVAPESLIARLPQRLLTGGALAVIAHIDRAFTYGFADTLDTPQVEVLRSPLEVIMKGKPVGLAMDAINLQWSSYAAQLGLLLGGNGQATPPQPPTLANMYIARDDARNYMVLGDPAVHLRTPAMV